MAMKDPPSELTKNGMIIAVAATVDFRKSAEIGQTKIAPSTPVPKSSPNQAKYKDFDGCLFFAYRNSSEASVAPTMLPGKAKIVPRPNMLRKKLTENAMATV